MNTKTPFEDRLLAELRHEIELRGTGREEGVEPAAAARAEAPPVHTPPRLAPAAGACAAAALAVLLLPGSPADSPAYAAERHADGSVTLTLRRIGIGPDVQHRLAECLRT